eukprot:CAMPEP_0113485884 /NCGR_PEP_ID=MMETSP0014_2-20120614/24712_1 /TAXON_ID=2857 /ORGANISM="Nitzschia sp." /LENGTH=355 /DNA_ID=CAMNT_0000379541 /DNA_START=136 /DNA_END=1200 /DNA_ORIENTATION=+ /assembly_acc=CAM_ASM_000159
MALPLQQQPDEGGDHPAYSNTTTDQNGTVVSTASKTMGILQGHGDSNNASRTVNEYPEDADVDDDENSVTTACMICWAKNPSDDQSTTQQKHQDDGTEGGDTNKNLSFKTLTCGHSGCHGCVKGWIERCEKNGCDVATCPHCRQSITENEAHQILGGRPYQRISQNPAINTEEENLVFVPDDLTQDWLDTNDTYQCTNCGMYTIRDYDDDDPAPLAACGLCGHIYCWVCKQDYEECDDDIDDYDDGHDHEEFYDPTSQIVFPTRDAKIFPIATQDDIQEDGGNMENFLARRKAAIDSYQRDRYEQIEPANYVFLTSVFDEYTESADYVFLTSVFNECTEPADYAAKYPYFLETRV